MKDEATIALRRNASGEVVGEIVNEEGVNSGVHVTVNGITGAGIRGKALDILLSPRPEPDLLSPLEAGDIRFRVFSGNQFCGRPGAFCPVFGIMGRDDCDARPVLQFEPVDSLHKCGEIGNKRRRRRD